LAGAIKYNHEDLRNIFRTASARENSRYETAAGAILSTIVQFGSIYL
jgi:chorismate synthase